MNLNALNVKSNDTFMKLSGKTYINLNIKSNFEYLVVYFNKVEFDYLKKKRVSFV